MTIAGDNRKTKHREKPGPSQLHQPLNLTWSDPVLNLGLSQVLLTLVRHMTTELELDLNFQVKTNFLGSEFLTAKVMKSSIFLGYNAVQASESQSTFRRNMQPLSSGLNSKPRKKPPWSRQQGQLLAGFYLGEVFNPEDGSDLFFRNVDWLSLAYTALYPGKQTSLKPNYVGVT
jgi:hypothetical protein